MLKLLNVCNLYLALCVLIGLNGILYEGGGFMAQAFQALFVLWSMYYALYANQKFSLPVYFKWLNVLLVMFTVYGVILMLGGERLYILRSMREVANTGYLKAIYKSLLPIYAFYTFTRKGQLTERGIKIWYFAFLALAVTMFFDAQRTARLLAEERGSTAEEFTINTAYTFVGLLPGLVLFSKRSFIQYAILVVCAFFIILGMKRGAILTGFVSVAWFMFYRMRDSSRGRKFLVLVLSLIAAGAITYYVSYMMQTSDYFNYRLLQTEEGATSGRDQLYETFYQHFINEESLPRFVFGNGANATLKFGENFAHNDWLEIAINQGVLGLLVYLLYWIGFYRTWRRSKQDSNAFLAIGMIFMIYLLTTFFSMSYSSISRGSAMVLGYFLVKIPLSAHISKGTIQQRRNEHEDTLFY